MRPSTSPAASTRSRAPSPSWGPSSIPTTFGACSRRSMASPSVRRCWPWPVGRARPSSGRPSPAAPAREVVVPRAVGLGVLVPRRRGRLGPGGARPWRRRRRPARRRRGGAGSQRRRIGRRQVAAGTTPVDGATGGPTGPTGPTGGSGTTPTTSPTAPVTVPTVPELPTTPTVPPTIPPTTLPSGGDPPGRRRHPRRPARPRRRPHRRTALLRLLGFACASWASPAPAGRLRRGAACRRRELHLRRRCLLLRLRLRRRRASPARGGVRFTSDAPHGVRALAGHLT